MGFVHRQTIYITIYIPGPSGSALFQPTSLNPKISGDKQQISPMHDASEQFSPISTKPLYLFRQLAVATCWSAVELAWVGPGGTMTKSTEV